MISDKLKRFFYLDTYGWIATTSALICALSGIMLAIPFDIKNPYFSVQQMLLLNPFAAFIRNLHYWSAQFFLVFLILHLYDHFKRSTEDNIRKRAVWLRLTISLAATVYVMISGFILKADPDAQQARNILSALFRSVPVAGDLLNATFIGRSGEWQLIYIQHAATATIFILIVIYEHARAIWAKGKTFLVMFLLLALLSFIFMAPLAPADDNIMKGPWYFLGLQEIMHYLRKPWIIMALSLAVLIMVYILPVLKPSRRKMLKILLLSLLSIYIILSFTGFVFRGKNWEWQWPWSDSFRMKTGISFQPVFSSDSINYSLVKVNGNPESCVGCHKSMKGLSESHSLQSTGCYSCHKGNPYTFNKKLSHRNMIKVPGNLSNAGETCGQPACHPGIVARVNNSLMVTNSGIVAVDRFVFGDAAHPDTECDIRNIGHSLASDVHLRNLCAGCHLGMEKVRTGLAAWLERGGGCNACHLHYDENSIHTLEKIRKASTLKNTEPLFHPAINIVVSNEKCRSCHSRSGRISMNYEGWHETELLKTPAGDTSNYQTLPDGRIFKLVLPDIHHERGMSCIDCHNSYELMGDGNRHQHKEQAVKVQCKDCHPRGKAGKHIALKDSDHETQLIAWLRGYSGTKEISSNPLEHRMVATATGGLPLVNTRIADDGSIVLKHKLSGKETASLPQKPQCSEGKAHDRLSCGSCHTSWAPQCIGCHNSYEKAGRNFDILKNLEVKGGWAEYAAEFLSDAPVLGVQETRGGKSSVITVTPGMILSIDKGSFRKGEKTLFHRLYAPSSPHTTRREARSCKSCHNNPAAIGYGRGELLFDATGKWQFRPMYEKSEYDGLPQDAWTGFLQQPSGITATRTDIRPFSIEEQKKILQAGACLTCHDEKSAVMKQSLTDFKAVIDKRSRKCRLPEFP